jgi:CO/xanthine dehydrogenase FAD-binding subunit
VLARPGLPSFQYICPDTHEEVVALVGQHKEAAALLMGGTDLFPRLRDGSLRPKLVVDVKHLPGMRGISFDQGAGLTVGAAVTLNALAQHKDVLAHYPPLAESANAVASYQVRNRATLGGNLCNASPCADTSPATLVLEARFVLFGQRGERSVPAGEFFLGPGLTSMEPGEFMIAVRFPRPPARMRGRYLKLGRTKGGDLSLVGVAVLGFEDSVTSGTRFRIALGSVAPVPLRALEAEQVLLSHALEERTFALASKKAMELASPISDVRGGAAYQKAMVGSLVLRALRDVSRSLEEG